MFACSWARYDLGNHGTFRLTPAEQRRAELAQDYAIMRPMFISEPPPFSSLLAQLAEAERLLNTV